MSSSDAQSSLVADVSDSTDDRDIYSGVIVPHSEDVELKVEKNPLIHFGITFRKMKWQTFSETVFRN